MDAPSCGCINKIHMKGQMFAFCYVNKENNKEQVNIFILKKLTFDSFLEISEFDGNKIELMNISSDLNYVATYDSSKALSLFRLKDGTRIAHLPIFGNPPSMIVTPEYVVLAVGDKGIMPYYIVDSTESKKTISSFNTRKKERKVTSADLDTVFDTLIQLLDTYDIFKWEKIFDENAIETEDTKKEITFDNYLDSNDVYECLLNYIRAKGGKQTLLEQFYKAINEIRSSKLFLGQFADQHWLLFYFLNYILKLIQVNKYRETVVKAIDLPSEHELKNNEKLGSEKSSGACLIS